MAPTGRTAKLNDRLLLVGGLVLIGLPAFWLVGVAWKLTADKFDAFDIYLNSRSLFTSGGVIPFRPLGLSALQSPIFALEQWFGWTHFAFRACHLLAALFYLTLLFFSFRLFRLFLGGLLAWFMTFLLAIDPLVVHSAPFGKEDIAAAAASCACFYCYLLGVRSERWRYYCVAGICGGIAISLRHNLPPVVLGTLFVCEAVGFWRQRQEPAASPSPRARKRNRRDPSTGWIGKEAILFVLPLLIFIGLPMVMYPLMGRSSFWNAPVIFFADMMDHARYLAAESAGRPPELLIQVFWYLWLGLTPPIALLSVVGMLVATARRLPVVLPGLTWIATLLVLHTLVIAHREARFFFPAYPAFFLFAGIGLEWIVNRLGARLPGFRLNAMRAAILALVAVVGIKGWLREWRRFRDPIFHVDFERATSEAMLQRAGKEHQLIWLGRIYSLFPADDQLAADDTACFCHFDRNAVEFFTQRYVVNVKSFDDNSGNVDSMVRAMGGIADPLTHDGDAVLINRAPEDYTARNLPPSVPPLELSTLGVWQFAPTPDGHMLCQNPSPPRLALALTTTKQGMELHGNGWPNRRYVALIANADHSRTRGAVVTVSDGQIDLPIDLDPGEQLGEVALVFFHDSQVLPMPN